MFCLQQKTTAAIQNEAQEREARVKKETEKQEAKAHTKMQQLKSKLRQVENELETAKVLCYFVLALR